MKKLLVLFTAMIMMTASVSGCLASAMSAEEAEDVLSNRNKEEAGSVQYVMYLGTNDKDTNEPVFSEEESMKKAQEILIRLFGGYTIQEARGGWLNEDGKICQEYTLVIYLSDTTKDKVHEAAREMIDTFRQSSVLIQSNPTETEFYTAD